MRRPLAGQHCLLLLAKEHKGLTYTEGGCVDGSVIKGSRPGVKSALKSELQSAPSAAFGGKRPSIDQLIRSKISRAALHGRSPPCKVLAGLSVQQSLQGRQQGDGHNLISDIYICHFYSSYGLVNSQNRARA
jgi:hypothetical protein